MPTVSVIIPVHGVEGYLDQCLDSVLSQEITEIIAVDDASPDRSSEVLAAREDPRLRVLRNESAVGPGRAREMGLKEATGEYVWFVDGDDALVEGAVAAVSAELDRLRPDLLVLDYENLYPDGGTGPSGGRFPAVELTTLAGSPGLINLTMTVWSKVFRRDFLTGLGVSFGPGIHEDVPVSVAALLADTRIAVLNRVCYRYRRSRRGSFMAAASDRHFDILTSYNAIFSERTVAPPVRAALFERAMWHYTTVLPLIPRRRQREFFRLMTRDFRRWRPAEFTFPPGARGVKLRLAGRGAYWTYRALEPVNKLRLALRRP